MCSCAVYGLCRFFDSIPQWLQMVSTSDGFPKDQKLKQTIQSVTGKRSLDRELCNLIRARVNWHGVAETEVMVMSFFDHGQHRDCFEGYSAVAERHL